MTTPLGSCLGRSLGTGVLLAVLCLAGCDSGPELYPLSGEVTYMGQPVRAGTIHFEPAGEKVDSRAITRADIQDGRYQLPRGKGGVAGGPYTVIISPCDGIPQEEMPHGKPLVARPYVTRVDLPREASTKNFDIPAQGGGR